MFRREDVELGARPDDAVRIQVRASGINWADIQQRLGLYPEAPPRPYAPGYEVAGDVLEAPAGSGFRRGQSVVAVTRFGGYASVIDVDAKACARMPSKMSYEEAAAVPVVWLTAHEALHERARVRKGESVLVHGGAGGVGLAAIALAREAGCTVYATAGGAVKCNYLEKEAGVTKAVDHMDGHWLETVRNEIGPVDHVLDPLGGQHLRDSLRALKPGGRVIAYGASATAAKGRFSLVQALRTVAKMRISAIGIMRYNTGIVGLNMLTGMTAEPERLMRVLEDVLKRMANGKLPGPVVAASFPLERVADAHRFLHDRANIGKVVLTV